jgi:hypothetical protein
MPESHRVSSRPWAIIFGLLGFSTSSTSSIPRFLPCGDIVLGMEFSFSAKMEGMCEVTFFNGLRACIASDDSTFLAWVDGEFIALGVRSPKARREGVW